MINLIETNNYNIYELKKSKYVNIKLPFIFYTQKNC